MQGMVPSLFGVVAPGRAVITEFMPVDATKCIAELANPTAVSEVSFFMLPGAPVPPGYGAVLYYSIPPFQTWTLVGSVFPNKPSGIFRTGWATNEAMMGCPVVQLGVSIEPEDVIKNLEIVSSGVDDRLAFAHKIALDLFQYMTSFSEKTQHGDMIAVPTNILDRWMERFNRKYRVDPNFMMKQQS